MLILTLNVSTTVLMMVQSNLAGLVFGKTPTSLKAMCPSSSKLKIPTFSPNLSLFLSAALRPALNYVIFLLSAIVTRFLIKLVNAFSKSKFWKIRNWDSRMEILWMEQSFWKIKDLFRDALISRIRFLEGFQVCFKSFFSTLACRKLAAEYTGSQ